MQVFGVGIDIEQAGDDLADRKAKATELIELLGRASR